MVRIQKKTVKGKTYYYLEHVVREGQVLKNKQKYLGSAIPDNIEVIKKSFVQALSEEKWFTILDKIKRNYSRESQLIPKSVQQKELDTFAVKFTYDTQRIEGSTLTLRETANLLQKGITPAEKPLRDVKEAEMHLELFYEILRYPKELSLPIILYWHKTLFSQTKKDIAGKIRNYGVAISGSKFIPPTPVEVELLLEDFMRWYHQNKNKLHAVELAALVHLKLVTIHPFGDGNGRISRLIMNFVFHKRGYPLFDIPYEHRSSYYNALERSQVKKNESIFVQWLIKRYVKQNQKYLSK